MTWARSALKFLAGQPCPPSTATIKRVAELLRDCENPALSRGQQHAAWVKLQTFRGKQPKVRS